MEKKQRVPKGEKYWFINSFGDIMEVVDEYLPINDRQYNFGNYFHTKEEAEQMLRKLRAVFNGADVIEMPSEEEIKERLDMIIPHNPCDTFVVEGICKHLVGWLKSKIVK